MSSVLQYIAAEWQAGDRHGFPPCCRARFILAQLRPHPLREVAPYFAQRLRRITPRGAVADGYVPCEYHVLKWLVTGRPGVEMDRRNKHVDTCCEYRDTFAALGVQVRQTVLRGSEIADPEDKFDIDPKAKVTIWELEVDGLGEIGVTVRCCPWCGKELAA